jgi:cytochrome c oxidase subunit 2
MKVHVYEKAWMTAGAILIAVFVATILGTAFSMKIHPPSHIETIDPRTAAHDPRFAALGVRRAPDGGAQVVMLASMWSFTPAEIRMPAHRPVTFRLTSTDVIHGFEIVGTNVNTMIVPGYVSQLTTMFDRPGEYLLLCNEYCGLGHHVMFAKLTVARST